MSDQVDTRFLSDGLIGKTLTNVVEKYHIGTVGLLCDSKCLKIRPEMAGKSR